MANNLFVFPTQYIFFRTEMKQTKNRREKNTRKKIVKQNSVRNARITSTKNNNEIVISLLYT